MGAIASQITSLAIVFPTVYSDADQRKHQSPASLAFVGRFTGIGEFSAKMASNAEMYAFDDVIMTYTFFVWSNNATLNDDTTALPPCLCLAKHLSQTTLCDLFYHLKKSEWRRYAGNLGCIEGGCQVLYTCDPVY